MQEINAPLKLDELLELFNAPQTQCIFIKNEKSHYTYANDNFIQIMGMRSFVQLQNLSDYDLYQNPKEAAKYQEYDQWILSEAKTVEVKETIYPRYNQPIAKTMQGKLYPLFSKNDDASFVLGVVTPESKLLKLDFNTLFNLSQQELSDLLIKRSYNITLSSGTITLSKMEIRTIVQLLKGAHAGEIAKALQLQQTTVESYLLNIRNKLGANNKSELIEQIINEKILQQVML